MKKKIKFKCLLIWLVFFTALYTKAATITVTSTGYNGGVDPAVSAGKGTLRLEIIDANTTGQRQIFNLFAQDNLFSWRSYFSISAIGTSAYGAGNLLSMMGSASDFSSAPSVAICIGSVAIRVMQSEILVNPSSNIEIGGILTIQRNIIKNTTAVGIQPTNSVSNNNINNNCFLNDDTGQIKTSEKLRTNFN